MVLPPKIAVFSLWTDDRGNKDRSYLRPVFRFTGVWGCDISGTKVRYFRYGSAVFIEMLLWQS